MPCETNWLLSQVTQLSVTQIKLSSFATSVGPMTHNNTTITTNKLYTIVNFNYSNTFYRQKFITASCLNHTYKCPEDSASSRKKKSSAQRLARREATMHATSFKVFVLPSFDELQRWRPGGGMGDRVINMPTKFRPKVRMKITIFHPA
jgi:hypothetical protein